MPTPLAGERVRTLRHLLDVSQGDLAAATGFSQTLISAVENGSRPATDALLDAIAAATSTPRSFFDVMPPELPPGTLRFRKLAGARRGDTRRAEALVGEAFRIAVSLLTEAKYPSPSLPALTASPTADETEQLAEEVRYSLGIGADGPVRHVTRACERGGVAVVPLSFPGDDAAEGEALGHFGASHWPGGSDPALIGFFVGGPGDRQRYTLAHELGHLVLHSRRRIVDDPEGEANRFAGAFLVPKHRAVEAFGGTPLTLTDFMHMKANWGVSIQALIMRGAHLGLIDDRRKTSLFKQLSARGWRKAEPVTVHPEHPMLMWKLLTAKYGQRAIYSRAGDPLGIQAHVLRSIAPEPVAA